MRSSIVQSIQHLKISNEFMSDFIRQAPNTRGSLAAHGSLATSRTRTPWASAVVQVDAAKTRSLTMPPLRLGERGDRPFRTGLPLNGYC
jgi:hypothetical protein